MIIYADQARADDTGPNVTDMSQGVNHVVVYYGFQRVPACHSPMLSVFVFLGVDGWKASDGLYLFENEACMSLNRLLAQ